MRESAYLDHLKPHKPIVRRNTTNITNNVRNMVNNNLRFNFSVIVKNSMPRMSFIPLANTGESKISWQYRELPFERYGFAVSDYEMYLHTSRLKEAYVNQKRFISFFRRKQASQNNFLELFQNNSEYDVYAPMQWNPPGTEPSIFYVTPNKDSGENRVENKVTERSETVTKTNEREHTHSQVAVQEKNMPVRVNVSEIVNEVSKAFEEKLRADRLKRGR